MQPEPFGAAFDCLAVGRNHLVVAQAVFGFHRYPDELVAGAPLPGIVPETD